MAVHTKLMEEILTSEEAQKIIDFVSPVYGNSYVALKLFQSIGLALDEINSFPDDFIDQIMIQTATWSLDYWEEQYGLYPEPGWSIEQRRKNLLENLGHRFNNPKKIENVLEVLTGHNVQIEENIEKNKFQVFVMGYVRDLKPVTDFVDKVKPAHLSYNIKMSELIEADVWIYTGICLSEHEFYRIEVE